MKTKWKLKRPFFPKIPKGKLKRKTFDLGIKLKDATNELYCLQNRLAIAYKNDNQKEIKFIENIILRSYSARVLAVHWVITNKGYRSPGFSGFIPRKNEDSIFLVEKLFDIINKPHKYKSTPLDRISILKADGISQWPISIPSYLYRCVQALYALILDVYC